MRSLVCRRRVYIRDSTVVRPRLWRRRDACHGEALKWACLVGGFVAPISCPPRGPKIGTDRVKPNCWASPSPFRLSARRVGTKRGPRGGPASGPAGRLGCVSRRGCRCQAGVGVLAWGGSGAAAVGTPAVRRSSGRGDGFLPGGGWCARLVVGGVGSNAGEEGASAARRLRPAARPTPTADPRFDRRSSEVENCLGRLGRPGVRRPGLEPGWDHGWGHGPRRQCSGARSRSPRMSLARRGAGRHRVGTKKLAAASRARRRSSWQRRRPSRRPRQSRRATLLPAARAPRNPLMRCCRRPSERVQRPRRRWPLPTRRPRTSPPLWVSASGGPCREGHERGAARPPLS